MKCFTSSRSIHAGRAQAFSQRRRRRHSVQVPRDAWLWSTATAQRHEPPRLVVQRRVVGAAAAAAAVESGSSGLPSEVDVIVVGAGVAGLTAAKHVHQAGASHPLRGRSSCNHTPLHLRGTALRRRHLCLCCCGLAKGLCTEDLWYKDLWYTLTPL
jgi:hypothetical protein